MTIPKIRVVHQNGSLIFLSFGPSSYMHDVHSAQYRCKASNAVGQIISGAVHINAGMITHFLKLFIIMHHAIIMLLNKKLTIFSIFMVPMIFLN